MTPIIRVCQKCGTEIPGDAPEGGCPGCLLETALDAAGGQPVFGRYTLVKILGRRRMDIIWLARDEELERHVALKFLPDLMIRDRALLAQLVFCRRLRKDLHVQETRHRIEPQAEGPILSSVNPRGRQLYSRHSTAAGLLKELVIRSSTCPPRLKKKLSGRSGNRCPDPV
jgi:hypothetical protein